MPQRDSLNIAIKAGFDGHYRPGAWTPFFVTLDNQPAPGQSINDLDEFNGSIMGIFSPAEDGATPVRFSRPVNVPPASRKLYTLYARVPREFGRTPELLLTHENGRTAASYSLVDLNPLRDDTVLVVSIGEALRRPNLPMMRGGIDRNFYTMASPSELPEHWAGWDPVDVVVLMGWPAQGFPPAATEALRDWIAMGGTLVILAGQDTATLADSIAQRFLPVELGGTGYLIEKGGEFSISEGAPDTSDEGLRAYMVASTQPLEGAETLLALDEVPLMVRQRRGAGQVVFFANDFRTVSRPLEQLFLPAWQAVTPVRNLAAPEYELGAVLREFKSVTGSAARPPNQFLIILICIVYTLVIGPINFGILGRKKRLEWAWVTVPAIVLVFFFLLYGIGRLTKGNTNVYRELALERFEQGSGAGSRMTVSNAFVSSPGRHMFRPMGERAVFADPFRWDINQSFREQRFLGALGTVAGPAGATALGGTPPTVSFDTGRGQIYIDSWRMGIFEARTFLGREPVETSGSIDAEIYWNNGRINGTITNAGTRDYEESWLLAGNELLSLGPLARGETVEIEEALLRAYARVHGSVGQQFPWMPRAAGTFREMIIPAPEDGAEVTRSNFGLMMSWLLEPPATGRLLPPQSGRLYFVGFSPDNPGIYAAMSSLNAEEQSRGTVAMVALAPKVKPGEEFVVPREHLRLELLHASAESTQRRGAFYFNGSEELELSDHSVMFSATLPFSHHNLRVTHFTIDLEAEAAAAQKIAVEVYSYDAGRWIEVPHGLRIDNAGMALPITGRMYFRIASRESEDPGRGWGNSKVNRIDLTLRGMVDGG